MLLIMTAFLSYTYLSILSIVFHNDLSIKIIFFLFFNDNLITNWFFFHMKVYNNDFEKLKIYLIMWYKNNS